MKRGEADPNPRGDTEFPGTRLGPLARPVDRGTAIAKGFDFLPDLAPPLVSRFVEADRGEVVDKSSGIEFVAPLGDFVAKRTRDVDPGVKQIKLGDGPEVDSVVRLAFAESLRAVARFDLGT